MNGGQPDEAEHRSPVCNILELRDRVEICLMEIESSCAWPFMCALKRRSMVSLACGRAIINKAGNYAFLAKLRLFQPLVYQLGGSAGWSRLEPLKSLLREIKVLLRNAVRRGVPAPAIHSAHRRAALCCDARRQASAGERASTASSSYARAVMSCTSVSLPRR